MTRKGSQVRVLYGPPCDVARHRKQMSRDIVDTDFHGIAWKSLVGSRTRRRIGSRSGSGCPGWAPAGGHRPRLGPRRRPRGERPSDRPRAPRGQPPPSRAVAFGTGLGDHCRVGLGSVRPRLDPPGWRGTPAPAATRVVLIAPVRARRADSASTWTVEAEFAAEFVKEWEAAWNSHDLDRVLSHYSEDVVFQSPYVVQRLGEPSGEVRGKEALRAYWSSGLQAQPTLHFTLEDMRLSVDTLVINY